MKDVFELFLHPLPSSLRHFTILVSWFLYTFSKKKKSIKPVQSSTSLIKGPFNQKEISILTLTEDERDVLEFFLLYRHRHYTSQYQVLCKHFKTCWGQKKKSTRQNRFYEVQQYRALSKLHMYTTRSHQPSISFIENLPSAINVAVKM